MRILALHRWSIFIRGGRVGAPPLIAAAGSGYRLAASSVSLHAAAPLAQCVLVAVHRWSTSFVASVHRWSASLVVSAPTAPPPFHSPLLATGCRSVASSVSVPWRTKAVVERGGEFTLSEQQQPRQQQEPLLATSGLK
jgi:hypothetical protein